MSNHRTIGWSNVASSWKKAYASCHEGDDFSKVTTMIGTPNETLNLGDSILYTYQSEEWKGLLRGGTIVRKMQFVVKEGKIISKSSQNLDRIAG